MRRDEHYKPWSNQNILRWWELEARKLRLPTSPKSPRCSTGNPRFGSLIISKSQCWSKVANIWTSILVKRLDIWDLICQFQHLLAFLFAELGTSGAIDGSNQLIMKGRFSILAKSSHDTCCVPREISAEAYRECAETVHQGVCHLPHMQVPPSTIHAWSLNMIQLQIPGHDPEQGDEVVLPAVHDLPLLLQCPDHQDRFPGDAPEFTFWPPSHVFFSRPSLGREGYFEPKPPRRSLSRLPRSSPWSSWLCYSPSLCIYLAWPLSSSGFQLYCCG